jgi:hypothetical protein
MRILRTYKVIKSHTFKHWNFYLFYMYSQVDHYEARKRPYTVVHDDVSGRNRQIYDRLRAVNHPFGMGRITVVRRRAVYGEKRTSFTLKSLP